MNIKKALSITMLCVVSIALFSCARKTEEAIVIKGSTTVLPITQKAAEAFSKKTKIHISLSGTGSGNGIKSLIDGSTDIAKSSRELDEEEKALAKQKGATIKEVAIAYDMIVPVVHPSNPINNLTLNQLKAIYDGTLTNWRYVGGKDESVVVISRDSSSGTFEVWESLVMEQDEVRKDALLQASNGAIVQSVSQNPRAIGYIGYGYINDRVKALHVNNTAPTIEHGISGKYPISRKLYFMIDSVKIKPAAQKFLDFVLSDEGQVIVKEAGFIPVKR